MCPSAFRVSSPPRPSGEGAGVKPDPKPSVENFIKIGVGVWISFSPPHTNRQTDRQTNKQASVHPFFIYI